jgi:hypothetical protein
VRRFFIGGELADTVTITGADARHIGSVLRLGPGAELVVVDKAGRAARVEITSVETAAVHVAVRERLAGGHEPPVKVSLAQGLPKGDKFEYIVQKAVGAWRDGDRTAGVRELLGALRRGQAGQPPGEVAEDRRRAPPSSAAGDTCLAWSRCWR